MPTQPGWTLARLGATVRRWPTMVRRAHRVADMTMGRHHQEENSRDLGEPAQLFISGKRERYLATLPSPGRGSALGQGSRLGEPLHNGCNEQDYGYEARDGGENRAGTGPQSPIQLLPSTADKNHFELLPPVLAQMAAEQQPPGVVSTEFAFPGYGSAPDGSKEQRPHQA
jgi:hypothetical protein